MQRASRIIGQLQVAESPITKEQVVLSAWPRAVGKRLAQNARAVKLVRSRLVVEVEDQVWQRNLFTLSRYILSNLAKHVGPNLVDDLEFRIMPRRRAPQRALHATPLLHPQTADEADAIQDPGLRRIYKSARLRESA